MLRGDVLVHQGHLRHHLCHPHLASHTVCRVCGYISYTLPESEPHLLRDQHNCVPNVCVFGVCFASENNVH